MMKRLLSIITLLAATALAGCGGAADSPRTAAADAKPDPEQVEARADVQERFGDCLETIAIARIAGYDYMEIVSDCLLRKNGAVHKLFQMTARVSFDGDAAEGHAAVLCYLLRDVGDRFFGGHLATERTVVQQAVRNAVLLGLGYGNTEITADEIRQLYPKTFPETWQF